jgi:hypothetical protein
MNHILDHKEYRFFQSSFDPDEMGTVLSVNHDEWGTNITYQLFPAVLLAYGDFVYQTFALCRPQTKTRDREEKKPNSSHCRFWYRIYGHGAKS